jgi:hypothetical protein
MTRSWVEGKREYGANADRVVSAGDPPMPVAGFGRILAARNEEAFR